MARVNINIAITAMITEKPLQENHSSTEHICEREYELGISSSGFNFTLSGETDENDERDTFDWTNRQSGLMLGTRAVPYSLYRLTSSYFPSIQTAKSPEKVDITTVTQQ